MSNLSSYYGLVDAKIRASDNYLPVLHFWLSYFKRANLLTVGQKYFGNKKQMFRVEDKSLEIFYFFSSISKEKEWFCRFPRNTLNMQKMTN